MLEELRIENLLLIERAELRPAPGLNVITGETGAGKTMLAQALDLLLGGRARGGIVRPGANEAYVEGVFSPTSLDPDLAERVPADAEELVLARRLWPDGRTRAYICGRAATVGELREVGRQLLAFYGQHEHRKLTIAAAQLELLDAHCRPQQGQLRDEVAMAYARVKELEQRVVELQELAGARERELDLLAFELAEIEQLAPAADEEERLVVEQARLRAVEQLRAAAFAAVEALVPEGGAGVSELLAGPSRHLDAAAERDVRLTPLSDRFGALLHEAEDLGRELRRYASELEDSPARLAEVDERLERYARLKRKHGGALTDVLAHAEDCRARITELERADRSLETSDKHLQEARADLKRLAGALSENRREAAPALAAVVEARLRELALADADFAVEVRPRSEGIGPRGADEVEFMFSANPGLAAGPLRDVGSGGELSRVMLALLSAAHGGGPGPAMLVFDEIDAGIGGHTARAVGEHLRALADHKQLLCITHLPQIASLAERHFRIDKLSAQGATLAMVSELGGEAVVSELVRMLGASEHDTAASEHARQLLQAA
jgi:DNA repair protein RecN (Recombination protein N)